MGGASLRDHSMISDTSVVNYVMLRIITDNKCCFVWGAFSVLYLHIFFAFMFLMEQLFLV